MRAPGLNFANSAKSRRSGRELSPRSLPGSDQPAAAGPALDRLIVVVDNLGSAVAGRGNQLDRRRAGRTDRAAWALGFDPALDGRARSARGARRPWQSAASHSNLPARKWTPTANSCRAAFVSRSAAPRQTPDAQVRRRRGSRSSDGAHAACGARALAAHSRAAAKRSSTLIALRGCRTRPAVTRSCRPMDSPMTTRRRRCSRDSPRLRRPDARSKRPPALVEASRRDASPTNGPISDRGRARRGGRRP